MSDQQDATREVTLVDIAEFLFQNWGVLALSGLMGAILSVVYLVTIPAKYTSTGVFEVAQLRTSVLQSADAIQPLRLSGLASEAPDFLIYRLRLPQAYSPKALKECGLERASIGKILDTLRVSAVRGAPNTVSFTVQGEYTPELARQCAIGFFEMIRDQQTAMLTPFRTELQNALSLLKERLAENQNFMRQSDVRDNAGAYLARYSEALSATRNILLIETALASDSSTRLLIEPNLGTMVAPPSRIRTLFVGTCAGLFVGLVVAILFTWFRRTRRSRERGQTRSL